ncbi:MULTISPECIES: hypothetical protein [Streptomyces]|uniref:hypothetical protein n=1 Tax=Streptomyces TaxID=1883 RepID=UPI0034703131
MSLAFQIVKFRIDTTSSTQSYKDSMSFKFDRPIRWEEGTTRPTVDTAIRGFELQFVINGNPYEYVLGAEHVQLDVETSQGHSSGEVNLDVNLRPMAPQAAPAISFKGYVEALVIADLID